MPSAPPTALVRTVTTSTITTPTLPTPTARPVPRSVVLLTAAVLLAGCSAQETGEGQAGADASAAGAAAAGAAAAAPNVVTFTASEYAFDAPAEIPAGLTTIRLIDKGKELHHVQLVKLDGGRTASDLMQALKKGGPLPSWAREVGGPNTPRPGGGESNATLMLEPGNYAAVCVIPSPDGVPHVMKGMVRPLTITPSQAQGATEPQADVTMKLVDYDYQLSTPLAPGKRVIRVENGARQSHEVVIARLAPGKSAKDLVAWTEKMQGPPPGEPIGGTTNIAPGSYNLVTLDLTPGEYALLCFAPDAKDGKPHIAHGMVKQIRVG